MAGTLLPPIKPLPMKDRVSMIFIQYGQIDVQDGGFAAFPALAGMNRRSSIRRGGCSSVRRMRGDASAHLRALMAS